MKSSTFGLGFLVSLICLMFQQGINLFHYLETKEEEAEEANSQSQSSNGKKQMRSQMLCELHRVKKEMIENSTILTKPEV